MIVRTKEIPVTETSYPFTSAKRYGYLDEAGYREAEYYMYGTSNVYQTEADGSMGIRFSDAPYVNRFIVRAPEDPASFSGNVVVEIINPTSFMELERMWVLSFRQLMRNGDIYVGITSKPNTIPALMAFDAERYAELDWSNPTKDEAFPFTKEDLERVGNIVPDQNIDYETGLFWDMLTDIAQLLKSDSGMNPVKDYAPKTVALAGWSQSGCYLVRYLNDFAYLNREHSVYDGFLAAGPPRYFPIPVSQYETVSCAEHEVVQVRKVKEPCIILQTESENAILGAYPIVRPDGEETAFMCRHYDITGASHDTQFTLVDYFKGDQDLERIGFLFGYGGKNEESNHYPTPIIVGAMFRNLFYWIRQGVAPQPWERIKVDHVTGENARDALGNAVGGIRTCLIEYPTGSYYMYSDINVGDSGLFPDSDKEFLFGHEEPFPAEMLKRMYGSLDHYRALVTEHTFRMVMNGFVIREDAGLLIEEAVSRAEARGLE